MQGPSLVALGEILTSWLGIFTVALLIVGFALFHAVRFFRAMRPRISHVGSACKQLETSEGEAGFGAYFYDIDERLRANPYMKHAWHEFSETLIFPGAGDSAEKIRNTEKPSAFFNRNSLLGGVNVRFYNALPNILTGSGIMFTFIGLVAGLGLASQGLASDDISRQRQALEQLLGGAALAFVTSIIGLVTKPNKSRASF